MNGMAWIWMSVFPWTNDTTLTIVPVFKVMGTDHPPSPSALWVCGIYIYFLSYLFYWIWSFPRFGLMVFTITSHFLTLCISNGNCISHTERIFLSNGNMFTVQIAGEKCQWSSDPFAFVCLSQGEGACERWRDWYGASEFRLLHEYGSSIPGKIFHLARCRASWQTAACTAGAPALTHHAVCVRNGSQLTAFMPICFDNTGASWILVNSMILFFSPSSLIHTKLHPGKTEDRGIDQVCSFCRMRSKV